MLFSDYSIIVRKFTFGHTFGYPEVYFRKRNIKYKFIFFILKCTNLIVSNLIDMQDEKLTGLNESTNNLIIVELKNPLDCV